MVRIKQKKITTRLNYNHETDNGYQVLFEILNYANKNFRIKVLDSSGGIIHLVKNQVKKDRVINHPKDFQVNTYFEKLKHRTKIVLEFLQYVKYPIDKQNVEKYLYKQIGDVYNYFRIYLKLMLNLIGFIAVIMQMHQVTNLGVSSSIYHHSFNYYLH